MGYYKPYDNSPMKELLNNLLADLEDFDPPVYKTDLSVRGLGLAIYFLGELSKEQELKIKALVDKHFTGPKARYGKFKHMHCFGYGHWEINPSIDVTPITFGY